MQLDRKNLRQALALATCTLIGGQTAAADADKLEATVLFYAEEDRVNVVEPVVFYTRATGDESNMTVRAVFDSLTGASPNGAVTTNKAQTFTGASGNGSYTVPAGQLPLRDFSDTRIALGLDFDTRVNPALRRATRFNFSKEEDYLSLGGNLSYARDFNQKLTTLTLGAGLSLDSVQPHGGAPAGLTPLSAAHTRTGASGRLITRDHEEEDDDDDHEGDDGGEDGFSGERKTVVDLLVGITQVLSRRTLLAVNYSRSLSAGYLTDPYKLLSAVDPVSGETTDYLFEKRPDSRNADIIYVKLAHHFARDVAHLAYRHFSDDWGIRSHTVELAYRYKLGERAYLEPQYRWYTQTAADFFRYFIVDDGSRVPHASADIRLAEMTGTTLGLKFGVRVGEGEFTARVAQMRQEGNSHPDEAFGVLKQFDLHPALNTTIINVGYSMPW